MLAWGAYRCYTLWQNEGEISLPKQALYLAWRPQTFEDVIGQEHITRTLRNSLKTGRIRHAYLFSGPRGTGKTTMARLLAKALNCRHSDPNARPCNTCEACLAVNEGRYMDLIEIDAATHTGVDDVRDLRDKIAFSPGEGAYKVYIIDEVHRFTGNAFDALLKTLEEPPNHAVFVLATTEIDKVPATIKSRCLPFEFRRVALHEVADRLAKIAASEDLNIDRAALELIARHGTGSVRDSISLLDQIVTDPAEIITLELTERILGTASMQAVGDLVEAILTQDAAHGLHVIHAAVDSGTDPRQFGQQVIQHLRAVLLAQTASADLVEASAEEQALYQLQSDMISRGMLLKALRAFNDAVNDFKGGWQPQLGLELAFLEAIRGQDEVLIPVMATPVQSPVAQAPDAASVTPVAVEAGSSPVIQVSTLRQRWDDVRRACKSLNRALPALLEYAQVHKVDGNLVIITVQNDIFRQKLEAEDKRVALERALQQVYGIPLAVRIISGAGNELSKEAPTSLTIDVDDPVVSLGLELGAEAVPYKDDDRQPE